MEEVQILPLEKYTNRKGQDFELTIYRHSNSPDDEHWIFSIRAKHAMWGNSSLFLFATTQQIATQALADKWVKTNGLVAIKMFLDISEDQGFARFPVMFRQ